MKFLFLALKLTTRRKNFYHKSTEEYQLLRKVDINYQEKKPKIKLRKYRNPEQIPAKNAKLKSRPKKVLEHTVKLFQAQQRRSKHHVMTVFEI